MSNYCKICGSNYHLFEDGDGYICHQCLKAKGSRDIPARRNIYDRWAWKK
jgi:hypothetical protein